MNIAKYRLLLVSLLVVAIWGTWSLNNNSIAVTDNNKTIEEGTYIIKSAINENYVLDIDGASKLDKGNLQIWTNSNVTQQRFNVKYLENGYYTITNVNSGKVLDVSNGDKESGTNVQQYSSNGTDAQKWKIKDAGNGYFSIVSKLSDLCLDVSGGKSNNGTNIQVYSSNSTNSQKFKFEKYGVTTIPEKTIEDGTYTIKTAIDDKYVLDISGASKADKANLQIWSNSNVNQQRFTVRYLDNGCYSIYNVNSNKVLDVVNGSKASGANVQQYTSNNTDAQKWIIKDAGNGYYYIISKLSGMYIDVTGGIAKNGINIQMFTGNSTSSQKFKFSKYIEEEEKTKTHDNTTTDNELKVEKEEKALVTGTKTVDDGMYVIKSALNQNYVFDISNNSQNDGGNVQLWSDSSVIQQRFNIKYLNNGYYTIQCEGSKKLLEVAESKKESGINVQQYTPNNSMEQQWVIKSSGDGYYYIISKLSGMYLDVTNAKAEDGANIQVYTSNSTTAQKFKLELAGLKTVDSGVYFIKTAINNKFVLDISGASRNNGANVQVWSNVLAKQQKFKITYNSGGYYTITSANSKKVLEVAGGGVNPGTNVQQYTSNGTNAQKWIIEKNGDGYLFISKLNGLVLNVTGQTIGNGNNVNVDIKNNLSSQKFYLEATSNTIDIDTSKYPGYKEKIEKLMRDHSDWEFELLYTGLSYNEVIAGEYAVRARNLLPKSYGGDWIVDTTEYDTGWYAASEKAISYYMDSRNFLNDVDVFQFLNVNLYPDDAITWTGIQNRVSGTYLSGYADDIINACKNQNVDPYYVIARLIQEQGSRGGSTWRMSRNEGTYYNPFNIGASGNGTTEVVNNAYYRARNSGWDTMQKAIEGGIYFLKQNYLENYQNTLYTNKFDIDRRSGGSLYTHQYMQNLLASYNEARNLRSYYNNDGKIDSNFTFIIPIYENMGGTNFTTPSNNSETYAMNVKTTGTDIRIRKDANINSEILGTIVEKGTVLLSVKRGVNSNWQQVITTNGLIGYMSGDYLTQVDDVKTCNYTAKIKTNDGDGCSIRVGPSTRLDRINAYSDGTQVTVIDDSTYKNIDGYDWSRVILSNGIQGFMPGKYLVR